MVGKLGEALLLHKSCQTKAIVDFSDLTIRMRVSHTRLIVTRAPAFQRSHERLFNYVIVTAGYRMCMRPDSTDVPTI